MVQKSGETVECSRYPIIYRVLYIQPVVVWDFWTINSIDSPFGSRIPEVGKVPSIYFLKRQGSSVEGVFWGLEGWWWGGVGTHHVPPPENEQGQKLLEKHPTFFQ